GFIYWRESSVLHGVTTAVPSAAECVPGGPSVACSSAKAIEWDEAFKTMDDPSGRAVGVHQSAYQ
uniref:hypothetical protein n=1 Tax=Salmonella enterica TaxID=28901 RepID=UPI0015FF4478